MRPLSALDFLSCGNTCPPPHPSSTLSFPKSLWKSRARSQCPPTPHPRFRSVQNILKKLKEKQWQISTAGSPRALAHPSLHSIIMPGGYGLWRMKATVTAVGILCHRSPLLLEVPGSSHTLAHTGLHHPVCRLPLPAHSPKPGLRPFLWHCAIYTQCLSRVRNPRFLIGRVPLSQGLATCEQP